VTSPDERLPELGEQIDVDFIGFFGIFPNCEEGFGALRTDELCGSRPMADLAKVLCSAAFVVREISVSVAWLVVAAISLAEQPASARRRAAALRRPWVMQRLGTPDWPILSAVQIPIPFGVKGFPNAVVRRRRWDLGQAASTRLAQGAPAR
jgi:hypothetical protein